MASSYSTDLTLELVATGEKAGLWGTITNNNLKILQNASSGSIDVNMGGGTDVTLSLADGAVGANGKHIYLKLIDTLTRNQTLIIPSTSTGGAVTRVYIIEDATVRTAANAYTLQIKTTGSGSPINVPSGSNIIVRSDGTNTTLTFLKKGIVNINSATNLTYTAVAGDQVALNTDTNTITVTLPATPSVLDEVTILDGSTVNGFGTNSAVVARNGSNINGATANLTLNVTNQVVTLIYVNAAKGWLLKSTNQ